jgi:hypothetical protein
MSDDTRYHPDFATDSLKHGSRTIARQIRTWLNERSHGGLLVEQSEDSLAFASGCKLFWNDFSFVTGGGDNGFKSHACTADLFLMFDGGLLYDFLSPDGDAAYMGGGWEWPLTKFCNGLGYEVEPITSYCFGIRKQ